MNKMILIMTAATLMAMQPGSSALASPFGATRAAVQSQDMSIEQVAFRRSGMRAGGFRAAGVRRGNIGVGRNLNVNRNRSVNVNRNVNRNANVNRNVNRTVVRTGAWVRPARYTWRPGAAVAAGAAIGFVSAASVAAWAGAAPGPNMCWYYTDASHHQGFWDACP